MTKDEIISMAKKFGLATWHNGLKRWTLEIGLEQFTAEVEALATTAERRKHQADIEKWKSEAATAEKWRGLALSKEGDGRCVERIQQEAAAFVGQSIKPQVQADTAPAAWAIYSDDGTAIRLWSKDKATAQDAADKFGLPLVPLYTAPQPTRQPLTDEKLYALYCEAMKGYYVSALHYWRETEAHKFARAIEAAVANQPPRQPLTEDQLRDALRQCPHDTAENLRVRWLYAKDFARAVEAAHGITGEQKC